MKAIDLNCDMGEGYGAYTLGADEQLMPLISSANIACGYHAGDPLVMDQTVRSACDHHVAIGAHPGYPDLMGFGRRPMRLSPAEILNYVLYQIAALAGFCRAHSVPMVHVKAHGALYNLAAGDEPTARALAEAIRLYDPDLVMVGLASSSTMAEAAERAGLRYAREAFADRMYNPDGSLQSRAVAGALITDPKRAARQAVNLAHGFVVAHDGSEVAVEADTLCLHGDNPAALANLRAVRAALEMAGVHPEKLRRPSA
jgi:UPF0271 protein